MRFRLSRRAIGQAVPAPLYGTGSRWEPAWGDSFLGRSEADLGATAFLVGFGAAGGGGGRRDADLTSPGDHQIQPRWRGRCGAEPGEVLSPAKPLTKNWRLTSWWSAASLAGRLKRSSVTVPSMTAGPVDGHVWHTAVNNAPRASSLICT